MKRTAKSWREPGENKEKRKRLQKLQDPSHCLTHFYEEAVAEEEDSQRAKNKEGNNQEMEGCGKYIMRKKMEDIRLKSLSRQRIWGAKRNLHLHHTTRSRVKPPTSEETCRQTKGRKAQGDW